MSNRPPTPVEDLYRHVAELEREIAELRLQFQVVRRRADELEDRILEIYRATGQKGSG